jgi:hypothetical protein
MQFQIWKPIDKYGTHQQYHQFPKAAMNATNLELARLHHRKVARLYPPGTQSFEVISHGFAETAEDPLVKQELLELAHDTEPLSVSPKQT